MEVNMQIILASSSPRRKELMKIMNIPFKIIKRDVLEELDEHKNHYEECMKTAKAKALAVYKETTDDVIVIGSDTIVSFNNKIYGKPKNYQEAFRMLKSLSDNSHEVISSLCLLIRKDGKEYEELTYDKGIVYIDKMSDEEIDEWIKNNDVYNKAGAYAIQEEFGKFIWKIEGDYFSIVGFPIHKLYELLKKYK